MPGIHPYLDLGHPIAFAHRGGATAHAENTERAFRHAIDLGFTHLETDVHVTIDGVAIAFHDDHLDRVTDREGEIAALPWAEVRRARVGGTEAIMRLDELFEAFPTARINLDPKHQAAVQPLADTINRLNAAHRCMVGSFSDRRIAEVRSLVGPELAASAGPRQTLSLWSKAKGLPTRPDWIHAVQVPPSFKGLSIVTRKFVDFLHARDIHIHVWTINNADEMHELLDQGVDGIMTDQLEVLRTVYQERGIWPDS